MEKEQKPIMKAVLRTSLRDSVFRSIAILLLKKIGEQIDSIHIDAPSSVTPEQLVELKRQYVRHLLQDLIFKNDAEIELNQISRQKSDLVSEILRQYGLHNNPHESTYFHDVLCQLFDECLGDIRRIVKKGHWELLGI